ncbi:MAG: hypothetical protein RL238_447 [Actinomycetota bacterium]|jgi:hypothetical protein
MGGVASLSELRQVVETRVEPDERVLGAFIGMTGPRPGVEAFSLLPFAVVLVMFGSFWIAAVVGAITFGLIVWSRTNVTVARTTRGVVLLEQGRRMVPSPDAELVRMPPNVGIIVGDETGDPTVNVGQFGLWVAGEHQDEARRLSKLKV